MMAWSLEPDKQWTAFLESSAIVQKVLFEFLPESYVFNTTVIQSEYKMQSAPSRRPTRQYRGDFSNFIQVICQNVRESLMKFSCHSREMIGESKDLAKNIS